MKGYSDLARCCFIYHHPHPTQDPLTGFDWGKFFNQIHRALEEISHALTLVQIGIGWVVPIDILKRELDFQLT